MNFMHTNPSIPLVDHHTSTSSKKGKSAHVLVGRSSTGGWWGEKSLSEGCAGGWCGALGVAGFGRLSVSLVASLAVSFFGLLVGWRGYCRAREGLAWVPAKCECFFHLFAFSDL